MTSPALNRSGGVAQYLRTVQPHFRSEIDYFTVGSRSDAERLGRSMVRLVGDWWRFTRTLLAGRYEMVHLNPSLGSKALIRDGVLLLVAKTLGRTVVVFTHGWDKQCERVLAGVFLPLFRWVYCRADAFIVLGREFAKSLRLLGYRKAIFVEGAPIEEELLVDDQEASPDHPKEQRFRVLFLARVERQKGVYEALDTFRILQSQYPFVEMIMAGVGPELQRARDYARSHGLTKVEFPGHLEGAAKRRAFASADAYLFPSRTEGLPISVLEAMAQGLPLVARAVGGLPDFFQNGRMGFLTERGEPEVFASLLIDDFQIDRGTASDKEPPAYGLTIGAEGGLGAAAWTAFYTRVTNLTYRTPNPAEAVMDRGDGLGRNFSDYDQVTIRGSVIAGPGLLLSPEATLLRQGQGDFRLPYPAVAAYASTPTFLAGVVERTLRLALGANLDRASWGLAANGGVHLEHNAGHVSGASRTRWIGSVAFTYRFHRESPLP